MRKLIAPLTLIFFLLVPASVQSETCTIDKVPGATLLFPYFEVDLPKRCRKSKFTTKLDVSNTSAAPLSVHVTIWSNWSVPVYDFNLYFTGYSSKSLDLADLLCKGIAYGRDQNGDPLGALSAETKAHIKAWLTGAQSPQTNNCASTSAGKNKAVGYITMDNMNTFVSGSPADGASYANNLSMNNVLVGDYYYIDKRVKGGRRICGSDARCLKRFKSAILKARGIHGASAVAIEADAAAFSAGDLTFYGRYLNAQATDKREPLPTVFYSRYLQAKKKKNYELIVWREANGAASPVTCGQTPEWHQLNSTQMVAFDPDANWESYSGNDLPFGTLGYVNETQAIANAISNVPYNSGWLYMNFSTLVINSAYGNSDVQAWVVQRRDGIIDDSGVHHYETDSCS